MAVDPFMNPSKLNVAVSDNDRNGGNVNVLVQLADGELNPSTASTTAGENVLAAMSHGTQPHNKKKS